MLDFTWLEDLVKTGAVREEVAGDIYNNCVEIIKTAAGGGSPGLSDILGPVLLGKGILDGAGATRKSYYDNNLFARKAAAVKEHLRSLSEMQGYKDFDKKFDQLVMVAPDVATNVQLAKALMPQWKKKAITTQDLTSLAQTQAAYHDSTPESAAKRSSLYAKQVKLAEAAGMADAVELYDALTKVAISSATITRAKDRALELASKLDAGDPLKKKYLAQARALAAGLKARAKTKVPYGREGNPAGLRGVWDTLTQTSAKIAPPLIVGAGIGGVGLATSAVRGRVEKNRLEQSFNTAMSKEFSNHEVLNNDPTKSKKIFNMLAHFAPEVAMEPHAANAFMARIHNYNDIGVQTADIKDLTDVARNMRSGKPSGGLLSAITGVVGLDKQLQTGLDNSNHFDT
jgi:hypothetical protein